MNRPVARAASLAVIVLLVAAVVTACGGASKSDYEAGLERVKQQLDDANQASQEAAAEQDADARAKLLADARAAIEKAAKTADSLDPPDDAGKAHAKLASALHDYADVFGELATLKDDDPDRAELYGRAGEIVDQLDAANRALKKAGYEVVDEDSK
jgi:hypothetical protein